MPWLQLQEPVNSRIPGASGRILPGVGHVLGIRLPLDKVDSNLLSFGAWLADMAGFSILLSTLAAVNQKSPLAVPPPVGAPQRTARHGPSTSAAELCLVLSALASAAPPLGDVGFGNRGLSGQARACAAALALRACGVPSEAIGPECDPKLAVASILITGSRPLRCPQCNPLCLQTKMHRCFSGKRIAGSVSSNLQVVLPASFQKANEGNCKPEDFK